MTIKKAAIAAFFLMTDSNLTITLVYLDKCVTIKWKLKPAFETPVSSDKSYILSEYDIRKAI